MNISGNQTFVLLLDNVFTGKAGELIYDEYIDNYDGFYFSYQIKGDINGDKFADFSINLSNKYTFSASDFIL
jgi:hypothetical protein